MPNSRRNDSNANAKDFFSSINLKVFFFFLLSVMWVSIMLRLLNIVMHHLFRSTTGTVLLLVFFHGLELLLGSLSLDALNDVVEGQNSENRNTSLLANLANGAGSVGAVIRLALLLALAGCLLLSVKGDNDSNKLTSLALDNADGLSDSSAGSHDIVNDNNLLALETLTNHQTTLAVVLDLLAVVDEAKVAILVLVNAGELLSGGCAKGNALVGGAEEDIELELGMGRAVLSDGASIGFTDSADQFALGEQTAVEEVRRDAAGLESKRTESQDVGREGERDEVTLVGGESSCGRHGGGGVQGG